MAALAPKAAPSLTQDPLGLLFSATAAGFGVLYLALAVCARSPPSPAGGHGGGGGPRDRRAGPRPRGDRQPHRRRARAGPVRSCRRRPTGPAPRAAQPLHAASRDLPSRAPGRLRELPAGPAGGDPTLAAAPPAGAVRARRPPPSDGVRDLRLATVLALGALAAVVAVGFEGRAAPGGAGRSRCSRRRSPSGRCSDRRSPSRSRRSSAPGRPVSRRPAWAPGCSPAGRWPRPPGGARRPVLAAPEDGADRPDGGSAGACACVPAARAHLLHSSTRRLRAARLGERDQSRPRPRALQPPRVPAGGGLRRRARPRRARAALLLGIVLWLLRRPGRARALGGIASLAAILLAPAASPRPSRCPCAARARRRRAPSRAGAGQHGPCDFLDPSVSSFSSPLASALSGRLIVAALRLPRLRRCSPMGVAASTVLAGLVSLLATARLSEWGGSARPRPGRAPGRPHGVPRLVLGAEPRDRFHPVGPARDGPPSAALVR